MLEKKAVIFDMDGLMFDSEAIALQTNLDVHHEYGYPLTHEMALELIGRNVESACALLSSQFGPTYPFEEIRQVTVKRRLDYYKEHPLQMKKGLIPLLDYLKKENIKMAVASSTRIQRVLENLDNAHITDYFDCIIGGNQVTKSKPDPEIFLTACKQLGVSVQDALVLEDSKNGILAAYQGGIDVICIPDLVVHSDDIVEKTYQVLASLDLVCQYIKGAS